MFKNSIRLALVISFVVVAGLQYAHAQDPERNQSHVEIQYTMVGGIQQNVAVFSDIRMPWRSKASLQISMDGLPTAQTKTSNFDFIICPTSEFGPLEYSVSRPEISGTQWIGVPIEYPQEVLRNNHMTYGQRYSLLEKAIRGGIQKAIELGGKNVRIAVASFFHPIYYDAPDVVAFYTLSGINDGTKDLDKGRKVSVTILSNQKADVKNAFDKEYNSRVEIASRIDKKESIEDSDLKNKVVKTFSIESEVDVNAERNYFLKRIDDLLDSKAFTDGENPLSPKDVMKAILIGHDIKVAPTHVITYIQTTVRNLYSQGVPDMAKVKGHVEKVIKDRALNKDNADADVEKIMNKLNETSSVTAFRKIGMFGEIMRAETGSHIRDAIERAVRK